MIYKYKTLLAVFGAAALCLSLPAQAIWLGFDSITDNNLGDAAIGEAQLFVEITDKGNNGTNDQVSFKFYNGTANSFEDAIITDVYFDDGSLLDIAYITDADDGVGGDPGVDFSEGASPGNLPGGNSIDPPFEVTAGFLADSDPPVSHKGVNQGEWLEIVFDLKDNQTFVDVVGEVFMDPAVLRIGLHVQGFASGGSESFVNNQEWIQPPIFEEPDDPPTPVPEPGTLLLFMAGIACLLSSRKLRI